MAVVSYKCPNCDGELVFHPRTQKYKCEYCASAFSQEEINRLQPKAEGENQESNHCKRRIRQTPMIRWEKIRRTSMLPGRKQAVSITVQAAARKLSQRKPQPHPSVTIAIIR